VYIDLVYGMYWQLNISTSRAGRPECVLIRALEPAHMNSPGMKRYHTLEYDSKTKRGKLGRGVANGPGKLCKWLRLGRSFYGEDVVTSGRLWVEDRGVKVRKSDIVAKPRIGIDYAGPIWSKKPWRFYIKNNPCVSRG
ncbi:MAG: DNA-3-methyladenine glycosylase, partial [Candidatus Paceibacteria bacterium]